MEDDTRLIPLSALQHYLFCPRQCALIHLEQLWAENRYTAEGRILHERADRPGHERRRGVHTVMALPLSHEGLGLTGVADVVEFDEREQPAIIRPIEYKRGRPKAHRADEVQLCAQALCLEAMRETSIQEGALYYGKTKRRRTISFDDDLRALTLDVVAGVRQLFDDNLTPPAVYDARRCDRCSLIEQCQPRVMGKQRSAGRWLERQLDNLQDD